MTKVEKARRDEIQALIDTNDRAVMRAVLVIYALQTDSEKETMETRESNKQGFGAFDAEILSSFAEQLKSGRVLSTKQMLIARRKIRCYWKQLALAADRKAAKATVKTCSPEQYKLATGG